MSTLENAREVYLGFLRSEYEKLFGTATDACSVQWLESKVGE